VFEKVTDPNDMEWEIPSAQLARGMGEEEDQEMDETDVGERESAHRKWVEKVCTGVQKVS